MSVRLVKVLSRRATEGNTSMWGTLHLSADGRAGSGWLCDSWSEYAADPHDVLQPRLYWLSRDDNKFHSVHIEIPIAGRTSITVGDVATMEPKREAFMRANVNRWEDEYLATEGVDRAE